MDIMLFSIRLHPAILLDLVEAYPLAKDHRQVRVLDHLPLLKGNFKDNSRHDSYLFMLNPVQELDHLFRVQLQGLVAAIGT
jgi:hypothetical protein